MTTPYQISFLKNVSNAELCTKKLSKEHIQQFMEAVKADYYFQVRGASGRWVGARLTRTGPFRWATCGPGMHPCVCPCMHGSSEAAWGSLERTTHSQALALPRADVL